MRYFKTKTDIRAIDSDQEFLIEADWVEITLEDVIELNKPTEEQILAQKINEAKQFLDNTDKKVLPDYEFREDDNTLEWYIEERKKARAFVRENS